MSASYKPVQPLPDLLTQADYDWDASDDNNNCEQDHSGCCDLFQVHFHGKKI